MCVIVLFGRCQYYADPKAESGISTFGPEAQAEFEGLQQRWSGQGLRVLLLTYRIGTKQELAEEDIDLIDLIKDLCIVGLVGIMDPPREETAGVIETCRGAGIRVFMVTGDNAATAASIAARVGIFREPVRHTITDIIGQIVPLEFEEPSAAYPDLPRGEVDTSSGGFWNRIPFIKKKKAKAYVNPQDDPFKEASLLLTGPDLDKLRRRHWDLIERYKEIVFARTTPDQKFNIVKNLQRRYNIVAVTGDGVNDAPALKRAHIGVAIGGGSDAAMESAAMVLLDANFSSIIIALRQGRTVFDNLKKVCLYLLPAGTFSELMPVLINIFLGVPLPLSSFLMM